MTKSEAFAEINRIQDEYVDELITLIQNSDDVMKCIYFTSPTGTGKTKMMSKLINKLSEYYYIITTLSKGQLHIQVRDNLNKDCTQDNYFVYGSADYRIGSKLDAEDIIGRIPDGKKCIWLRDEGHIKTNRWDEILLKVCYKVVNFSATNEISNIECKFAQTMMLRTVNQATGTPKDAIDKLMEIKVSHKDVPNYNPCAIFRCIEGNDAIYAEVLKLCKKYNLSHIDITDDPYTMSEICMDNNEYDVIINKFKITEGIDIRRAHVLYMDNQPKNAATTIQVIGRCRRNALLYSDDIDILAPENKELLKETRECYVFYNVRDMKIDTDEGGELQYAFCDHISCEALKAGTSVYVENGQLDNGLYVVELEGKTGWYDIIEDTDTGFNIVSPITDFYDKSIVKPQNNYDKYIYIDLGCKIVRGNNGIRFRRSIFDKSQFYIDIDQYKERLDHDKTYASSLLGVKKVNVDNFKYFPVISPNWEYGFDHYKIKDDLPVPVYNVKGEVSNNLFDLFMDCKEKYTEKYIQAKMSKRCIDDMLKDVKATQYSEQYETDLEQQLNDYLNKYGSNKASPEFRKLIESFDEYEFFVKTAPEISGRDIKLRACVDDFTMLLLKHSCMQLRKERGCTLDQIKHYINCYITLSYWRRLTLCFQDEEHYWDNLDQLFHDGYFDRLIQLIFSQNIGRGSLLNKEVCYSQLDEIQLSAESSYNVTPVVKEDAIEDYFTAIDDILNSKGLIICKDYVIHSISTALNDTEKNLKVSIIDKVSTTYESLFECLDKSDLDTLANGTGKLCEWYCIPIQDVIQRDTYKEYAKVINDRESALIGVDAMYQAKDSETGETIWRESKPVTSKISRYSKLYRYITDKYKHELDQAKSQYFGGHNTFALDKKCNSMIGYCVEYYSKYLVYGATYLRGYLEEAMHEIHAKELSDKLVVRACILKYRENMVRCFGFGVSRVLKSISAQELIKDKYDYFTNLIVELGTKTAKYVSDALYSGKTGPDLNNIDPNLSVEHITGLADYITEDTILDVKVTNCIDERYVRQVLAYHYLSTKRSDLNIKKVIVFDAVSEKSVVVNITDENIKKRESKWE